MGFYETPVRRLRLVRACCALVLAVAFGVIPFVAELDPPGRIFSYALSGACLLAAALYVLWSRRTPPERTVVAFPEHAPLSERPRLYRRMLWVSAVAFPLVAASVAYELHQLETGAENVRIWAPLVPAYEHLGYWPTVLAPLVLGAVCCAVFLVKLRKLSRR